MDADLIRLTHANRNGSIPLMTTQTSGGLGMTTQAPAPRRIEASIPNEWSEDMKRLTTTVVRGNLVKFFSSQSGYILALIERDDGQLIEAPARCCKFINN